MSRVDDCPLDGTSPLAELLCATLAQACNRRRHEVALDTQLTDLHVDSLTLVTVLTNLEAVYGIEITPGEVLALLEAVCVSDLADRLSVLVDRRG